MNSKKELKRQHYTLWRLINSSLYFDKTGLIEELVNSEGETLVISAPAGFFKSSNIAMLRTFFKQDLDSRCVEMEGSKEVKFELFKNCHIYHNKRVVEHYLGQFPVISINLEHIDTETDNSDDDGGGSGGDSCRMFSQVLRILQINTRKIFRKISGCKNKTSVFSAHELLQVKKFAKDALTEEDLKISLKLASALFFKYFRRKTFIFVENYDHYVRSSVSHTHRCTRKFVDFFTSFFGTLVGNEHVYCLVLTSEASILRIPNADHYSFLEPHKLSPYFGITERELEAFGQLPAKERDDLAKTGYYVRRTKRKIFSPWVLPYTYKGYYETFAHLIHVIRAHPIFEVPQIKTKMQILLQNSAVNLRLKDRFEKDDIFLLQELLLFEVTIRDVHVQVFFTYLFEHGLFTEVREQNEKLKSRFGFQVCTLYRIANEQAYVSLASLTNDIYGC